MQSSLSPRKNNRNLSYNDPQVNIRNQNVSNNTIDSIRHSLPNQAQPVGYAGDRYASNGPADGKFAQHSNPGMAGMRQSQAPLTGNGAGVDPSHGFADPQVGRHQSSNNVGGDSASGHTQRKLQNMRKSRYATNAQQKIGGGSMSIGASGHLPSEAQKSYRGPVLKGGLQIGQTMNNNALVGSFPNSTKNQVTTVTNKFSARDQSPNKKG